MAVFLAIISMFIVKPDKQYLEYIDFRTLAILFCLMCVMAGFQALGVFKKIATGLIDRTRTLRSVMIILVLLCFFFAMVITNDVALITFVPFTFTTFNLMEGGKAKNLIAPTIVLETIAANLGSMLTPIGNPQNLFVYDEFHLTAGQFITTMLPAGLISGAILVLLTLFLPKTACISENSENTKIKPVPTAGFAVLFAVCLLTVFRVIPDWACLIAAVAISLIFDRKVLAKVDYALLATFVCFFVFVGNIARIEPVREFFSEILVGRELIVTCLLSQVISNVPATVMLAGFTDNGTQLILGADIGGLGTIIASLASLISFQIYRKSENSKSGRYLLTFTGVSVCMLSCSVLHEGRNSGDC